MDRKIYDESTIQKLHKTLKMSMFQTYYKMLSNQFRFEFLYIFILIYELIINLFLIVFNLTYSEYNKKEYANMEDFINFFRNLILLYPNNNYYFASWTLVVLFTLFLIQLFTYFFNYKDEIYVNNLIKEPDYFKFLYYRLLLFLNVIYDKVLFHPILITIFSMFQCSNNNSVYFYINYPNINCSGFYYYFNLILGIISFLLFVLISFFNILFLNDSRPITNFPLSNPNNKIKFINLAMKFFLSFFYIINMGKLQFDFKYVMTITLLLVIFIYRFLKPLYHSKLIFNITIYCEGVLFFFTFFSMINKYTGERYEISSIVFFSLSSLLFGLLTINIFHRVQNYYKFMNIQDIKSSNSAYNKIMLLIEDAKEFKICNLKKSIFLGLLQKHRIKCSIRNCNCHTFLRILNVKNFNNNIKKTNEFQLYKKKSKRVLFDGERSFPFQSDSHKESRDLQEDDSNNYTINECVFGIIKIYLEELSERFPKASELSILIIYLNTYYLNNINKSLFQIMKVYRKNFSVFEEFKLFYLYNEMESLIQKRHREKVDNDFDIENVLKYNNLSYSIIEEMEKVTEKTIEFWQEVKSSSDKPKIYEAAVEISNSIRKIKYFFSELNNNLGFKDINFFKLFIDFLEKIIFHERDSTQLREKLISLQSDIDQITRNENENLTTFINMEDVGSVVISGKSSEIGKILSVNLKFCSIFKYESSQLLNNSINKIMPQYISQFHDNFIRRYMETAKKNIIDQDRILFGLKSTGFIRPILIHAKLIPNLQDNIRFIGLVKKLKKTDNFFYTSDYTNNISTSYILCTDQGYVYGITKNVCERFGIPLNLLLNNKRNSDQTNILNIKTIFPEINIDDEESTKGLEPNNGRIIKLDSKSLKSFYEDFKETVLEGNNKTFKFLNNRDKNLDSIFTEHDILLFMHNSSFNDYQVNCKVFKFVKLPSLFKMSPIRSSFLEDKNSVFPNSWIGLESQLLSPIKRENDKYYSSDSVNNYKNKSEKDKMNYQDMNKYRQNLFSLNYPKQVKIFILVVILIVIFLITISIIELLITINNVKNLFI